MYDAFISYSSDDKSIVKAICNYLLKGESLRKQY